ncbi:uncharacterized protein [Diadema antillarum]|uniref:uncharacterized protein n=1 Tax=Diadema antillarum TaxID=105358 RepID=UPI003A8BDF6F
MVTMATLIEAAKNGHYDTVEQVLRTGRTDINCRERESGGTALFWAANCGHKEIVELLLHYGADVEIPVKWQFTPLLAAVDRKHYHTAKTLLTGGANVNVQSEKGDTPLHLAAFRGSIHLCQLLLSYHAQTGILNNNGKTPQQEAEGEGHTAITKLLAPETNQRVYRSSSLPLSYQNVARIPSESDESLLSGNRPRGSLRRQLLRQSQIMNNDCSSPVHRHDSELVKSHSTNLLQTVGRLSPPNQAGDANFKGRRSPSSPLVQYPTLGRVSPPILQGISQNFNYHYPGNLTKRRNSPPAISRNLVAQTAPIAPAHVILRQPPVNREGETQNRPKETSGKADGHSGHHQCKRLDRETKPQSFSSFQSPKDGRQTCASSSTISNTNGDVCLKLCDGPGVKSDSFPEIDRLLNIIEDLEKDKISLLNENQNLRETIQSLESLVDLSMTTEGSSSSNSSCQEQSCTSCGDRTMRGSTVLDVKANQRILLLEATCRDLAADNHKLQSQVISLSQGQTIVEEDETAVVQKVNGDIQGLETTTSEVSQTFSKFQSIKLRFGVLALLE